MTDDVRVKIEYWPIAKLKRYAKNPRDHSGEQIDEIAASMDEFAPIVPIIVDARKGANVIVAGEGRLSAHEKRGDKFAPVIPVQHLSAKQVRAFRLVENRLRERSSWNPNLLQDELRAILDDGLNIEALGLDAQWIKENLSIPNAGAGSEDEEQPEPPANPYVRPGDLWQLGEHRLFCGSSINAEDVQTALGGAKPPIAVTDPPYGVKYDPTWRDNAGGMFGDGKAKMRGKVSNDDKADWRETWALFPGDVVYVWCASLTNDAAIAGIEAAGFVRRSQIIWRKPHFLLSRGDYHWQHEPCWYAIRKGGKSGWNGSRKETTVWDIAGMNPAGRGEIKKENERSAHGTQKPVACMTRPIENNSRPGDHVYEPFSGSGTTIIACEMTGRRCIAIEIDPAYVQIAVERWQRFTGKEAKLIGVFDGEAGLGKSPKQVEQVRGGAHAEGDHREPVRRARRKPAKPVDRPVAKQKVRARRAQGQPAAG